ncbi:MAG: hypothetical protein WAS72_05005 [Saprospiraceae bacterium]
MEAPFTNMILQKILLAILITISCNSINAQSYITAIGMRLGTEVGFTIQQRVTKHITIESIVQSNLSSKDFGLSLLFEQHQPLLSKRLNFYLGAGPHLFWKQDSMQLRPFGATVIFGAEISVGRLNISYDFKPAISFLGVPKTTFEAQTALSIRYIFIKQKRKKINWKFWEKWDDSSGEKNKSS